MQLVAGDPRIFGLLQKIVRLYSIVCVVFVEIRLGAMPATSTSSRPRRQSLAAFAALPLLAACAFVFRPADNGEISDLADSVAAASVIAKVARDRLMEEYDALYPGYDLARNKGYAAPEHRAGLEALGLSIREYFSPIKCITGKCRWGAIEALARHEQVSFLEPILPVKTALSKSVGFVNCVSRGSSSLI